MIKGIHIAWVPVLILPWLVALGWFYYTRFSPWANVHRDEIMRERAQESATRRRIEVRAIELEAVAEAERYRDAAIAAADAGDAAGARRFAETADHAAAAASASSRAFTKGKLSVDAERALAAARAAAEAAGRVGAGEGE